LRRDRIIILKLQYLRRVRLNTKNPNRNEPPGLIEESEVGTCPDAHCGLESSAAIQRDARSWKSNGKIFPNYEGLGVCTTVAFTNHSCYPNMEVHVRRTEYQNMEIITIAIK
jgi:hypothetical protein